MTNGGNSIDMTASHEGQIILPKAVSLGNVISWLVTVIAAAGVGVATFWGAYTVYGWRVAALEQTVAQIPATYATVIDMQRLKASADLNVSDTKAAISELGKRVEVVLDRQGVADGKIEGLKATIEALRDSIGDIKRTMEQQRRTEMLPAERQPPS